MKQEKSMILFSDFDQTLFFRNDPKKTNDNFEAIVNWRTAGNQFCITTGRSYSSILLQFPQIEKVSNYYIVDSGSIILSHSGDLLKAFYFKPKIVSDIINFSKNLPEALIPFYYTPTSENGIHKINEITKLRLWSDDVSILPKIAQQINKLFPVFALVNQNVISKHKELVGQKGFIEIIPINYGKGHAIQFLQQNSNISANNIITIGDGLNDYEMIKLFNGFSTENSVLSKTYPELNTAQSISSLINQLLRQ